MKKKKSCDKSQDFGAPAGIRIPDTLIKSQVLCQLSYGHICHAFYSFTIIPSKGRIVNLFLSRIGFKMKNNKNILKNDKNILQNNVPCGILTAKNGRGTRYEP